MTAILSVEQTLAEGCIGASDAAAALGCNPYRSPLQVWQGIRGVAEPRGEEPEPALWGKLLEPIVRGVYATRRRVPVAVPTASYVAPNGWLRATPDGIVCATDLGKLFGVDKAPGVLEVPPRPPHELGAVGLLQVKTASAYLADLWDEWIPKHIEIQVRVEMHVLELPWCDVVCLLGGQRFVGPIRVERDEKIERAIIRDLTDFWESTKTGREPDVDASHAWRRYASEQMRRSEKPVVVTASPEDMDAIQRLRASKALEKDAVRVKEEQVTRLLMSFAGAGATVMDAHEQGRLTAYQSGAGFDHKGFAGELETLLSLARQAALLAGQPDPLNGIRVDDIRARFKREHTGWSLRTPRTWSADTSDNDGEM